MNGGNGAVVNGVFVVTGIGVIYGVAADGNRFGLFWLLCEQIVQKEQTLLKKEVDLVRQKDKD